MSNLQSIDAELFQAVRIGNIHTVSRLIREGANVNATDQWERTPLHWAAAHGHEEAVQALLDKGANVNAQSVYDITPLHLAAEHGRKEVAKVLLNNGANVNATDNKGETPLHWAAVHGHKDIVEALLDKGANVNATDEKGKTPLDFTNNEEIRTLLENAKEPDDSSVGKPSTDDEKNSERDNTNTSGHDYADNSKKINIFYGQSKYIVSKAALDQNIHNVRKIFSECINDNVEKMSVAVLDKNNLQQHSHIFDDSNSIHVNFDSGNQVLVYSWPHYHQFDENKWNNFLLQLEKDSNVEFIGTGLLQFKYKGFNYRVYPLSFSLEHGKAFDSYQPEVLSFSQEEVSQIIEDIKESHQSIEKKIIDHYKSLGKSFAENNKGYIHIKAGIDRNDVKNFTDVSYTNRSDDIHNKPIEEAFVKDDIGGNLLHSYVYENKEAVMKHMFNLHIYNDDSINAVNANGKTPLHLAAKYGREGMVKMLLNKKAEVDVVDSRGRTPLHLAAQDNNKEIVDALIKAKANVNIKDEDGKTPFDLTTDEEIKTLLQPAENPDAGSVDEPSTDSEGVQEEGDAQPGSDINGSQPTGSTQNNGGQTSTTSAGQRTAEHPTSAEPNVPTQNSVSSVGGSSTSNTAQTEEQPSSFFGSLFSILMKPFSLIASFFGGFFSWLFGSDTDESTSQTDVRCEGESSSCDYDATRIDE